MSNISIISAQTRRTMDDFVRLPRRLYRGCRQYVPDLDVDVRAMFSTRRNAGLAFCLVQPFVAYRDGEAVGRVCAIINYRANQRWQTRCVRFGLIEFVDDVEVSTALMAAVEQWGHERGMTTVQGPLGITDFDKEGMLIEDFELTGAMTSIYNYDYYPRHMERLGYTKAVDWVQVRVSIPQEVPARYRRVAQLASDMFGLGVRTMTAREARGEYARQAFRLLNQCYAPLFGFTEFTTEQMEKFTRKYLLLIDRSLMPVVENSAGDIVGIAVTMVSVVQALQRAGGRLLPLGWWRLLRALKWKHEDHAEMLLVAVRPDCQGYGVNALFFDYLIPIYNQYGIRWAETGPQLEDNVRVLAQWKPLNPQVVKRRRCYTKELDPAPGNDDRDGARQETDTRQTTKPQENIEKTRWKEE